MKEGVIKLLRDALYKLMDCRWGFSILIYNKAEDMAASRSYRAKEWKYYWKTDVETNGWSNRWMEGLIDSQTDNPSYSRFSATKNTQQN